MKTKPYRSILAASLTLACLSSSAWAVTLPVAQDNSSLPAGTFSAATGKATTIAVAPTRRAYVQFDLTKLPASVTAGSLRNARLLLYTTKLTTAGNLSVSDVTTAWSETSVGGAATVGGLIATIPGAQLAAKRFVVVDVTAEVFNWLSGAPNNGIAISSATANLTLGSKEGASTGYPAELEIDINPAVAASGDTVLSGRTGIGTSTPSQLLDVAGNQGQFVVHPVFGANNGTVLLGAFNSADNNGGQLRFGRTADFMDIGQNGSGAFVIENFFDAALLTVQQDGNVGIGTTTPATKLQVNGDVKLGNSGEYFAASAEENLKTIRGTFQNSGGLNYQPIRPNLSFGSVPSYSVVRSGVGFYTVTFTTPFGGFPSIVANPSQPSQAAGAGVTLVLRFASFTFVEIMTYQNGVATDVNAVSFIATGPR